MNYAIKFRDGAETILFRFSFHLDAVLTKLAPLFKEERDLRLGALISNAGHSGFFHVAVGA